MWGKKGGLLYNSNSLGQKMGCGDEALEASFSFGFRYRFISAVIISA